MITLNYKEFEKLQEFMLEYGVVEVNIRVKDDRIIAEDIHTDIEKDINTSYGELRENRE